MDVSGILGSSQEPSLNSQELAWTFMSPRNFPGALVELHRIRADFSKAFGDFQGHLRNSQELVWILKSSREPSLNFQELVRTFQEPPGARRSTC